MFMRIIWGKILPGQWDAFETAFKKALETRGKPKGLQGQWLIRDENDPDAGYSISQWDSTEDMAAWRKSLFAAMHLNANLPAAYFGVPAAQVVEVGLEVEI